MSRCCYYNAGLLRFLWHGPLNTQGLSQAGCNTSKHAGCRKSQIKVLVGLTCKADWESRPVCNGYAIQNNHMATKLAKVRNNMKEKKILISTLEIKFTTIHLFGAQPTAKCSKYSNVIAVGIPPIWLSYFTSYIEKFILPIIFWSYTMSIKLFTLTNLWNVFIWKLLMVCVFDSHRENSPVTQTTPEPTLLSWGGWPREKSALNRYLAELTGGERDCAIV